MSNVAQTRIRVIAHRGASAVQPENTAAAFDEAMTVGADGIELDLQLTRDGVVVVWHDHDLARLDAPGVQLEDCDWSWLSGLDIGRWWRGADSPHQMLTLATVLERWAHRITLYLEIKCYLEPVRQQELTRKVVELLHYYGVSRQVAILSFDTETLATVHRLAPEVALVCNAAYPDELAAACQLAGYHSAVCVNIKHFNCTDVVPAHRAGLPLYTFTCDTFEQCQHARQLGVTALMTNRPHEICDGTECEQNC